MWGQTTLIMVLTTIHQRAPSMRLFIASHLYLIVQYHYNMSLDTRKVLCERTNTHVSVTFAPLAEPV